MGSGHRCSLGIIETTAAHSALLAAEQIVEDPVSLTLLTAALASAPLLTPTPLAAGDAVATFTGTLVPDTLPSICQEGSHRLACNGARIKSTSLDLEQLEGKLMKFEAVLAGVECDIWNVLSATPASATLVSCGTPIPGCPVRFRVGPTGVIGQYFLFGAVDSAFVPLGPTLGTQLIELPGFFLGSGPTFGDGSAVDVAIPNDLGLVGLDLWFQGGRFDIGPVGPIELTNAVCFTIGPPLPPCFNPDC